MVNFDGYIWVNAVSDGRLWLADRDSRAGSRNVYVLEPGAGKVRLAARLARPGTIIGANSQLDHGGVPSPLTACP